MTDDNKRQRVERLYQQYFKANGYQLVDSDDLIFMLSELRQLYFPDGVDVRYTKKCKDIIPIEEDESWKLIKKH